MNNSQESFEKLRPIIEAIPDEEVVTPTMPPDDIIGEAEELLNTALEDKDILIKSGLKSEYIDSLSDRIGAYAISVSEFNAFAFTQNEAKKEWNNIEPEAIELKQTLMHYLRFIFKRNDMKEDLKSLAEIAKGRGRRDLLLDLMDLHKLASKHLELLKTIGMDESIVNDANDMFERLRALLGDIKGEPEVVEHKKMMMKKAYTYLWKAVDEIRDFGQFAFWKDENKLEQYRSEHYRNLGKMSHDD
jgi:antitoxin component HigA of HigAB toxin-antitoxin module